MINQIDKRFNFHSFNARLWYLFFLKSAVWNEICWLLFDILRLLNNKACPSRSDSYRVVSVNIMYPSETQGCIYISDTLVTRKM